MSDYKTDWHLLLATQRPNQSNVYCYNGSAHIHRTSYRAATTCPKCIEAFNAKSAAERKLR